MFHPVSRAAAVAATIGVLLLWLLVPNPASAFADLVAPIVNAQSAKFKMVTKTDLQPKEQSFTGYFLAPNRYRQEIGGAVNIADFDRGRMMTLIPATKQALIFNLKGGSAGKKPVENYFSDLRAVLARAQASKQETVEKLGEKNLDGRRVFGYRLTALGQTSSLWGDVATGRLVRIEATFAGPPKTEVVFSDFEFDVALEPSLFALDPPADYKPITAEFDVSPGEEKDFVEALRRLSDGTDGTFPAGFDSASLAMAFAKMAVAAKADKGAEALQKIMVQAAEIGRGLRFAVLLPAAADAHYAGKGVKRQDPKVPIFWYKPAGGTTYRVIASDLSVSEAPVPPRVGGAVRLHGEGTK